MLPVYGHQVQQDLQRLQGHVDHVLPTRCVAVVLIFWIPVEMLHVASGTGAPSPYDVVFP